MNQSEPRSALPADFLFVFAGADDRKYFAIDAWRKGRGKTLVVSVARFEWRRVPALGLPGEGGLLALVEATPPVRRLFQLVVAGESVEARVVPKGRWGTWSEAVAFARLVRERKAESLLVCTSDYHLPRALLSVRRALARTAGPPCTVTGLGFHERPGSPLEASRRWRSPLAWIALAFEGVKYLVYWLGIPTLFDRHETDR